MSEAEPELPAPKPQGKPMLLGSQSTTLTALLALQVAEPGGWELAVSLQAGAPLPARPSSSLWGRGRVLLKE